MPQYWRVTDPDLMWRHWRGEDEWVAYSPRSADVHLLNEAAYHLIATAAHQPSTAADLTSAVAGSLGRSPDSELHAAVIQTIADLDRAGLLEPASA